MVMPAAAVAGGVAVAGLVGAYMSSEAQKSAAKKASNTQIAQTQMAIAAQEAAEQRARDYYQPYYSIGVRAATPISDQQYSQMTRRPIMNGQGGWNYSGTGTPWRKAGAMPGVQSMSASKFNALSPQARDKFFGRSATNIPIANKGFGGGSSGNAIGSAWQKSVVRGGLPRINPELIQRNRSGNRGINPGTLRTLAM
jgi:hypothetical protein